MLKRVLKYSLKEGGWTIVFETISDLNFWAVMPLPFKPACQVRALKYWVGKSHRIFLAIMLIDEVGKILKAFISSGASFFIHFPRRSESLGVFNEFADVVLVFSNSEFYCGNSEDPCYNYWNKVFLRSYCILEFSGSLLYSAKVFMMDLFFFMKFLSMPKPNESFDLIHFVSPLPLAISINGLRGKSLCCMHSVI